MLDLVDGLSGTTIVRRGGLEIVVDLCELGSGPTVLVLHGVEGVAADREFLKALAADFSVLAPSHPGFGLSPRPDWLDSVDDIAYSYLDWLEQRRIQDLAVVGLQFGAWLAAEIAVRNVGLISRLVLVDPIGIKLGAPTEREIADVFAISRAELASRMHSADGHEADLSELPIEDVMHIARNEEALALFGWEPYLHNPKLHRWLHRISPPSLVLWGEGDGITSQQYARGFADLIPDARFQAVPAAGHAAQVDQPERVADLIRQFIAAGRGTAAGSRQ